MIFTMNIYHDNIRGDFDNRRHKNFPLKLSRKVSGKNLTEPLNGKSVAENGKKLTESFRAFGYRNHSLYYHDIYSL